MELVVAVLDRAVLEPTSSNRPASIPFSTLGGAGSSPLSCPQQILASAMTRTPENASEKLTATPSPEISGEI